MKFQGTEFQGTVCRFHLLEHPLRGKWYCALESLLRNSYSNPSWNLSDLSMFLRSLDLLRTTNKTRCKYIALCFCIRIALRSLVIRHDMVQRAFQYSLTRTVLYTERIIQNLPSSLSLSLFLGETFYQRGSSKKKNATK